MLSLICLLIVKIQQLKNQRHLSLKSGRKRARILKAYLQSWIARLNRVLATSGLTSQIDLFSIRQALASVLFGRGLLHS